MLYTLSYSRRTLADLHALVEAHAAVLVDIRETPASRWYPERRQGALRAHFGTRYVWCQALGNLNYKDKGGPIHLRDYPAGLVQIRALLHAHGAVILLCGCPAGQACHRLVAGGQLSRDLGVPLEHL
jgi:uncharacterized protein DUF488